MQSCGPALETAQAAEFVRAKPLGLDEPVEQGGRNLSGGQKQRLTIARALVGKPRHPHPGRQRQRPGLRHRCRPAQGTGRRCPAAMTVFIVSQRAASLQHADQILVLDDGHLVGLGTHARAAGTPARSTEEIYDSQFKKGDAQAMSAKAKSKLTPQQRNATLRRVLR